MSDQSGSEGGPTDGGGDDTSKGRVSINRTTFWTTLIIIALVVGALSVALAVNINSSPSSSVKSTSTSTSTSTTETSTSLLVNLTCAQEQAANTYVQIVSVIDHPDGSATISAHPVVLHCGGPDDRQYLPQSSLVTVQLLPNANVQILKTYYATNIPATLSQLNAYIAANWDGNIFLVVGPSSAATGIIGQFHP